MELVLEVLFIQILSIYIVNLYLMFPLIRLPVITLLIMQKKFLELLLQVKMMDEMSQSPLLELQEKLLLLVALGVIPLQMATGRI